MKKFWFFAVPCIFWWFFVLYMIFGNFQFQGEGFAADRWGEIFGGLSSAGSPDSGNIFAVIVVCLVMIAAVIPLIILATTIFSVLFFFAIPIDSFSYGFYFDNWLIWFAIIVLVLTVIGAFYFKLGSFQEDSTVVTGHHYEAEYNAGDDNIKIKKVEETKGGGEYILNFFLFLLRMLIIAVGGIIVALVYQEKK